MSSAESFNELLVSHMIMGSLESSLDLFSSLLDALPVVFIISDHTGRILKANPMAQEYLKAEEDQLLGKSFANLLSGKTKEHFESYFHFTSRLDPKSRIIKADSFIDNTNPARPIFWQANSFVRSIHRAVLLNIVVGSNTTEFRRAFEKEILQKEKLASIATLAKGVAHEVNNPLSVISGFTELLKEQTESNPRTLKIVPRIMSAIDRIMLVVANLRKFSSAKTRSSWTIVDLGLVVSQLAKEYEDLLKQYHVDFMVSIAEDLPPIFAESTEIKNCVDILLSNAIDAVNSMPNQEKRVKISVYLSSDHHVCMMISDNGIGMNEETLNQIYDPFFTLKDVGKGIGLGMSILHNTIKNFNGVIEIDSQLLHGTEVKVSFPAVELD